MQQEVITTITLTRMYGVEQKKKEGLGRHMRKKALPPRLRVSADDASGLFCMALA
jgi:hypothetical protein